jgi:hypothetical protein
MHSSTAKRLKRLERSPARSGGVRRLLEVSAERAARILDIMAESGAFSTAEALHAFAVRLGLTDANFVAAAGPSALAAFAKQPELDPDPAPVSPMPEPAPTNGNNGNSDREKLHEEGLRRFQEEQAARPRRRFGPFNLYW